LPTPKDMIIFLHGPNTFASRRQLDGMAQAYLKKTGSDLGLDRIDGASTNPAELSNSLHAAPFLASSRLVIINRLSQNKTATAQIEKIINQIPPTTVAVFYEETVDQRTTYFKALARADKVVVFGHLAGAAARTWIKAEAKRLGAEIDPPALQMLLDHAGGEAWRQRQEINQWRLQNELTKLAAYSPSITAETIRLLVEPSHSQNIFDLVESMTSGQADRAGRILNELMAAGANELYLLTMIIWQLRNLLLAKSAGPISPAELARSAGMSPYVARKMQAAHRRFSLEQLAQAFQEAVETEYLIKTGAHKPDVLLERLVLRLSANPRSA
jgi:DNA polymerase-3 subunit delta